MPIAEGMQIRLTTDTDVRRRRTAARGASGAGAAEAVTREKSPFLQILDEVLPAAGADTRALHDLWEQLPGAERDLLDHPSDANLKRYKEVVIRIARETLRRNARVKKVRKKNRNGDVVELSVVEFVDERLQLMATLMHAVGNSAFRLLKTVEEIRGVLLDVRE